MFCKRCSAPIDDDATQCPHCGTPVENKNVVSNQKPITAEGINKFAKGNWLYILTGIAVIAVIWGILNLFSVFHVKVKASGWGYHYTEYASVYDSDGLAMVYIGNILFGLACLGVAAIGILFFLKKSKNMPYYDQFIASRLNFRPALMMGVLGTAGAIVQMLCYLCCRESGFGFKASVGVNWTTWLLLIVFIAIAVYDKLVLEGKEQAEEPVAEEQ